MQFKTRLTGAVILVILAVLIVPELLTGPKTPAAKSRPADNATPLRSYTIDLTGATPPKATADAWPTGTPAEAASSPNRAGAPANAAAASAAVTGVNPTPAITARSSTTSASSASSAAPPAAARPLPARAHNSAVTPRVAAGFVVQLGSFANHDTATRLAKELQSQGFTVSTTTIAAGGRQLLRVRVGPVADRAAAEALLKRLTAIGHKGPIVPYP